MAGFFMSFEFDLAGTRQIVGEPIVFLEALSVKDTVTAVARIKTTQAVTRL